MISPTAEKIIRDKVAKPSVAKNQQTGSKKTTKTSKENNDLIATLRREIEDLKSQRDKLLATKDQQIDQLTKLIDQAQQLQLMSEKKAEVFKEIDIKSNKVKKKTSTTKKWWKFW